MGHRDCGPYVAPSNARGRVQIVSNNVVTDNNLPLRGNDDSCIAGTKAWPRRFFGDTADDYGTFAQIAEDFHLNVIRVYCFHSPQNWPGAPDPWTEEPSLQDDIDYLDWLIPQAIAAGFYVVIDYHPVGGHDQDALKTWWGTIAPRYKDFTNVIYEACNEPVAWSVGDYTAQDVDDIEEMYTYIRALAPDTHIILWSFANLDGDAKSLVDTGPLVNYSNASVGYHPYTFNQTQFNSLKAAYPVFLTEIGGDNDTDYQNRTTTAESNGVSWMWLDGDDHIISITWSKDPLT